MVSENELRERMVRVEAEVEHLAILANKREVQLSRMEQKLDLLERDLTRYRGLVGGILLVFTSIVTFFKLFWDDMAKFFK